MWKLRCSRCLLNPSFGRSGTITVENNAAFQRIVKMSKDPIATYQRSLGTVCFEKKYKKITRGILLAHNLKSIRNCSGESYEVKPVQENSDESPVYYRTLESDPRNHDERHLGRIYTMPDEIAQALGSTEERAPNNLVPSKFLQLQKLFGEYSFLVRKPALEVIGYLNQIKKQENSAPCNNTRFILWGETGCGKSSSLAHIEHYCHIEDRVILNFHKFKLWFTHHKEMAVSEYNPSRFDHLGQSLVLLRDFAAYNSEKLKNLVTHKTYNWSEKEKRRTKNTQRKTSVKIQNLVRPELHHGGPPTDVQNGSEKEQRRTVRVAAPDV